MDTLTITCPADGDQFAVVEPDPPSQYQSLTVTCPSCGEEFAVVYPDELRDGRQSTKPYEQYLGEIVDWESNEDPPAPYTASDKEIPTEQYITATINGLGGQPGVTEGGPEHEEALNPDRFQIWYTPAHEEIAYVVRGDLETGVKTKNVYSFGPSLFVKNRGVPRDSDKQWTYLDLDECRARAVQAGLSGKVTEASETDGRYNIRLDEEKQPLFDDEGALANELVLELARTLVAFQTERVK